MFDIITTAVDIAGASLLAVGIGICFGVGAALIAGGILAITASTLADLGGNK